MLGQVELVCMMCQVSMNCWLYNVAVRGKRQPWRNLHVPGNLTTRNSISTEFIISP